MTSETIEEAEAALKAEASRLSAGVHGIAPDLAGEWSSSELAVRLLLANLTNAPVAVFERARAEHWASHDGVRRDDCHFCGYCDAAVYQAKTGRSLAADFLSPASPVVRP